jgi:hypothetical protein
VSSIKVESITEQTIKTFYSTIPKSAKDAAICFYDKFNKKFYWAYSSTNTLAASNHKDSILVFDLLLHCFYKYKISSVNVNPLDDPSILGFTQDRFLATESGFPVLKVIVDNYFCEFTDETFKDFVFVDAVGADAPSFIETWPDHAGDPIRVKQAKHVYCYFKKTEDGFVENCP